MFTKCVHKLKQCTNLRLHDENYTSFVVSLLVHKMGGGGGGAYSRGGGYFKFRPIGGAPYSKESLIRGGGGGANSKIYGNGHGSYGVLAKSSDFQPNPDHTFNCPGFSEGTRGTDRACCKFWTYFR